MSDEHNPYIVQNGKPELKKTVVAFVDILGYQSLIREADKNGTSQTLLTDIHDTFSEASGFLGDGSSSIGDVDIYKMRTLTDNVIIGYPIRDDAESELGTIYDNLSRFRVNPFFS